ncbi:MAG: methyltransferase [Bdellovibrionales bacterium]
MSMLKRKIYEILDRGLSKAVLNLEKMRWHLGTPSPIVEAVSNRAIVSRAIFTLVKLKIADQLLIKNQTSYQLANTLNFNTESLDRFLQFLTTYGVLRRHKDETFSLTPTARLFLTTSSPNSLTNWVEYAGSNWLWESCSELTKCIQQGKSSFQTRFQKEYFQWLEENPEASQIFNRAMQSRTRSLNMAILGHYDFSSYKNVVDIAGGHGGFLCAVLEKYKEAKGVLFDQKHVIGEMAKDAKLESIKSRIQCVGGDILSSIDAQGDLFVLRHILHNWSDEDVSRILKNCRVAMGSQGRLLIIEMLTGEKHDHFARSMDMVMLLLFGPAKERSSREFEQILETAGLKLNRVIETGSPMSILEVVPKAA